MSICIVAATALELQALPATNQHDVLITGVGAAATTWHLTKKIKQSKPSLIIQAGIAGCFDQNIPPGTPLIVSRDRFADLGVEEQDEWKDIFDMELENPYAPPYSGGWLINPNDHLLHETSLQKVTAISISEVTTNHKRIRQISEKYHPILESMEGAALHYVCLQENIPFIQLRTVSNHVGERDKTRWRMKEAIENLAREIQAIIRKQV